MYPKRGTPNQQKGCNFSMNNYREEQRKNLSVCIRVYLWFQNYPAEISRHYVPRDDTGGGSLLRMFLANPVSFDKLRQHLMKKGGDSHLRQ